MQLQVPSIFIFLLLVCGSYLQVDGAGCSSCTCVDNKLYKVLILGGGMSGIAAAEALRDNGYEDYLILEGYSKVGGRLRKMDFAGGTIELGANWIQGDCKNGNCNPISKLADDTMLTCGHGLGSEVQNRSSDVIMYDNFGSMYTNPNIQVYPNQDLDNYHAMLTSDISVRTALNYLKSTEWTDIPNDAKKNFTEWYNHDFCFAAPPEDTSLLQTHPLPTYENFGTTLRLVTDNRGYEHILNCILPNESMKVRTNTTVTKVINKGDCVCVNVDTIQSGQLQPRTYCGEYAIVTFSIGVLKEKHETFFEPRLSLRKTSAIRSFTMPLFLKIFLHFNSAVWKVTTHRMKGNNRDTSAGYKYIGYASETRGYYPVFVPLPNNVLMAVVTSPLADSIRQKPKNEIKLEIMVILRKIYGNSIPDPDEVFIPEWETDPLFLGTYSNTPVGVTKSTHETLAEREGQLFFAGEAASADYSGFVHGAYFAGKDAGNMVACASKWKRIWDIVRIAAIIIFSIFIGVLLFAAICWCCCYAKSCINDCDCCCNCSCCCCCGNC